MGGNPLQDPKILQRIFEFIPYSQCKELRKVNSFWNQQSCLILQNSKTLIIKFKTVTDIAKYTEMFIQSQEIPKDFPYPHSNYHFYKIRLHLIFDNYTLRKFFKTFGSRIKHLQLDFTGQTFHLKFLRISIWNFLQNNQIISSLSLNFKDFNHLWPWYLDSDQSLFPLLTVKTLTLQGIGCDQTLLRLLISKFLSCLPNVTKIHAGKRQANIIFEICYILTSLPLPFLEELDLASLSSPQIKTIISEKFQIKKLKAILHEKVEESDVKVLLEGLSSSLENLFLDSNHLKFPKPLEILNSLITLELNKFICNVSVFSKNNFPSLKKLKIFSSEIFWKEDEIFEQNLDLDCLTIESCIGLNSLCLKGFAKMFPNLKKLDIPVPGFECEENLLGTICEEMPNLEELYLSHDSISDENLTGIPLKVCRDSLESIKYGKAVSGKNTFEEMRQRSVWIGNLKKLRVLEIKCLDVSDFGVIYGILYCKTVEKLKLHSPYLLTNLSVRAIGDGFAKNLISLDLFCSNQITNSAIEYIQRKMKGRKCIISENKLMSSDSF